MASFIGKKCVGKTTATYKHECNKVLNQHTQCQICKSNHCRDCHMSKALKKTASHKNNVGGTQQQNEWIETSAVSMVHNSSMDTVMDLVRSFESAVRQEKARYPDQNENDIKKRICLEKLEEQRKHLKDAFFSVGFYESDHTLSFQFYSQIHKSLLKLEHDVLSRPV
jgi:cobalamin-dependent methionine synthase I